MKYLLTIWLGKIIKLGMRLFGSGGTAMPGLVLTKLNGDILQNISSRIKHGSIVITGTNGKTTSARLLSDVLSRAGYEVVSNSSGSNLERGLVSEFLDIINWKGEVEADIAVLEIDEADLKNVLSKVFCKELIVTNLFRDQLDRYGELESLKNLIAEAIRELSAGSHLLLNADDPLVRSLEESVMPGVDVLFFGVNSDVLPDSEDSTMDVHKCIKCSENLNYKKKFFSHLGEYKCEKCGFARPELGMELIGYDFIDAQKTKLSINSAKCGLIDIEIALPGVYNFYNVLAVVSSACLMDVDKELVVESMSKFKPVFGRYEKVIMSSGKSLFLMLSKNPTGFNELIKTILINEKNLSLVFVLNDNYADGKDVSWIWDVDFEKLRDRVNWLAIAGKRAEDMKIRMKYADISMEKVGIEKNMQKLIADIDSMDANENIYVMATYTGMLEFRDILAKKGLVKQFWKK